MLNATVTIEAPQNEATLSYGPGSPERRRISAALSELRGQEIEIPLIIGGREVRTGRTAVCTVPHDHRHRLAVYHLAGPKETAMAVEAARDAAVAWTSMAWADRLAIFLKAADLIAGSRRMRINAATMLGQGKNVYQAEIEAACESADFLRFYCWNATRLFGLQPISSAGVWNQMEYRPLEGFVFAISPFNFTALGVNLAATPALLGNTVIWKPASSAVYSAYHLMRIFHEAGLPDGVINFLPGPGSQVGPVLLKHPELAGVHFTGSTEVFREIWKTVGANIDHYRSYPRLVGETGGKDFVFAHPSADPQAVAVALVRGAFEYQGQKCSAASRAYIPKSIWKSLKELLLEMIDSIRVGPPEDFSNFVNAVIDKAAFDKIVSYIEFARKSPDAEIIVGGTYDDRTGYFIHPTVIRGRETRFQNHGGGDLRAGAHAVRLRRRPLRGNPAAVRPDVALRLDRLHFRPGAAGHRDRQARAGERRRQLLHQRQAHRGHDRPAALRRRPGLGDQRQGRHPAQPAALGLPAHDQGDVYPCI